MARRKLTQNLEVGVKRHKDLSYSELVRNGQSFVSSKAERGGP